ncbi:MAG: hypothetical protein ACU0CC_22415 [Sagittula sp.]|uniref:hypothetical protein n=1 Tax=Sagittula sp. TaxID=2038081 RepID=UPI00405807E9
MRNFKVARLAALMAAGTGAGTALAQDAREFQAALDVDTIAQEADLVTFFEEQGLKVYKPDREAFRNHMLGVFRNSKYSADWPEGLPEKINGL